MPDVMPNFELHIGKHGTFVPLPEHLKRFVTSIEFVESFDEGSASALHFEISDSHSDKLDPFFDILSNNTEIIFQLGYGSDLKALFMGVILEIEPECPADGVPKVTYTAHDYSSKMKVAGKESQTFPYDVEAKNTFESVINEIAAYEGFGPVTAHSKKDLLDIPFEDVPSLHVGGLSSEPVTDSPEFYHRGYKISRVKEKLGATSWKTISDIADLFNLRLLMRLETIFIVDDDFFSKTQPYKFDFVYNPDDEPVQVPQLPRLPLYSFEASTCKEGSITRLKFTSAENASEDQEPPEKDSPNDNQPFDYGTIGGKPTVSPTGGISSYWGGGLSSEIAGEITPTDWEKIFAELLGWVKSADQQVANVLGPVVSSIETAFISQPTEYLRQLLGLPGKAFDALVAGDPLGVTRYVKNQKPYDPFSSANNDETIQEDEPELHIPAKGLTTKEQLNAAAKAKQEHLYSRLTEGSGSMPLMPLLRAGQRHHITVNALGRAGKLYSGEYLFTSVTHSLSPDGYKTSFEVSRPFAKDQNFQGEVRSK